MRYVRHRKHPVSFFQTLLAAYGCLDAKKIHGSRVVWSCEAGEFSVVMLGYIALALGVGFARCSTEEVTPEPPHCDTCDSFAKCLHIVDNYTSCWRLYDGKDPCDEVKNDDDDGTGW